MTFEGRDEITVDSGKEYFDPAPSTRVEPERGGQTVRDRSEDRENGTRRPTRRSMALLELPGPSPRGRFRGEQDAHRHHPGLDGPGEVRLTRRSPPLLTSRRRMGSSRFISSLQELLDLLAQGG